MLPKGFRYLKCVQYNLAFSAPALNGNLPRPLLHCVIFKLRLFTVLGMLISALLGKQINVNGVFAESNVFIVTSIPL